MNSSSSFFYLIKYFSIFLTGFIFILSFKSHAPISYAYFNSDQAVHILMAHDLKLPEDLYYWGQNRLGSLVPILSHLTLKILPLSAGLAVSCIHFVLLLLGYLCFSSSFPSPIARITLGCIWFFPLRQFFDLVLVGQPYTPQFFFLGIFFLAFSKLLFSSKNIDTPGSLVLLNITLISAIGSCWISEQSIVPIGIYILFVFGSESLRERSRELWKHRFVKLNSVLLVLLGFCFLIYAKNNASGSSPGMFKVSGYHKIYGFITKLTTSIWETVWYQARDPFLSVHATLSLLFIVGMVVMYHRNHLIPRWRSHQSFALATIYFTSGIVSFLLLLFSRWVHVSGDGYFRYFVVVYVLMWLAALSFVTLLAKPFRLYMNLFAFIIALSSMSTAIGWSSLNSAVPPPMQNLQKIKELGAVSFVGDYWSSYILCSVDPKHLACTPHDKSGVRCQRCVEKSLAASTIYLVKNDWLSDFPAEIEQFGKPLTKVGSPIEIDKYVLAPYQVADSP